MAIAMPDAAGLPAPTLYPSTFRKVSENRVAQARIAPQGVCKLVALVTFRTAETTGGWVMMNQITMQRAITPLWRGYMRVVDAIERPSRTDGRLIILLCLLLYFGALARCLSVFGDPPGCWTCMGAPEPLPVTAGDLIIFPPTVRHMDEGASPYAPSPYDPYTLKVHRPRSFNYPRIWLILPRIGLTEGNVGTWRLMVSIAFFLAVISLFGELKWLPGLMAALAICSPAVMFGVERGNTDHWLFILLAAAVFCFNYRPAAFAGYGLLMFAAILKLYPALAFLAVLREQTRRRRNWIAFGLAAAFAVYLYLIRGDLPMIAHVTPQMIQLSFGRRVLLHQLSHRLDLEAGGSGNRLLNLASFALLAACIALAAWAAHRIRRHAVPRVPGADPFLTAFRMGAVIFVGVFATAVSFDYRLVFLLLTVPQILDWMPGRDLWGAISTVAIVLLVLALWLIHGPWTRFGLDQLVYWTLFVYFVTALLVTLPRNGAVGSVQPFVVATAQDNSHARPGSRRENDSNRRPSAV
jgi:hypothetical protein